MTLRVLLVDDVPEVRALLRTALRFRGGFEVVAEAGDGQSAVDIAVDVQPDLVVLDLGLPGLAGHEVISQLRAHVPQAKVIVFTGGEVGDDLGTADARHDDVIAHADAYVVKDAELDYLVDLLEDLGRAADRSAEIDLDRDPRSPALARRFVEDQCVRWRREDVAASAALVVSELVTNAVTHANCACRLRVALTATTLRLEVTDSGGGTPDPFRATLDDEHGRGLVLVTAVATAWGVQTVREGKTVWAEIALVA